MIASRRLSLIPSFVVLVLLTVSLSGCRSSVVRPAASSPHNKANQMIDVQKDASIAQHIVYVEKRNDKITWTIHGGATTDTLDISIKDPYGLDPFAKIECANAECSVKLKRQKASDELAEGFKYTIIVHHLGGPDSTNDPVIIWR